MIQFLAINLILDIKISIGSVSLETLPCTVTDNIGKEDCAEGGRESGWTNTESQCSYD
jgi:hypothetical protein